MAWLEQLKNCNFPRKVDDYFWQMVSLLIAALHIQKKKSLRKGAVRCPNYCEHKSLCR